MLVVRSMAGPMVVRRRDTVVLSAPVETPSTSASHSARNCRAARTARSPSSRRWLALGTSTIDPSGVTPIPRRARGRRSAPRPGRSRTHCPIWPEDRAHSPGRADGSGVQAETGLIHRRRWTLRSRPDWRPLAAAPDG